MEKIVRIGRNGLDCGESALGFRMDGMEEKRRGFVTTVSVAMMLVALLSLTAAIAHYSSMMREANSGLAQIAGAQEQFDQAAYGARAIAEGYGMGVEFEGNRMVFGQDLESLGLQSQAMEGWESFLAAHGRGESFNSSQAAIPKIYISLENGSGVFSIEHDGSGSAGSCGGCNRFLVNGSGASMAGVRGYNVTVRVPEPFTVNATQIVAAPCGSADAIKLELNAEFVGTVSGNSWCVDRNAASRADILAGGDVIASAIAINGGALAFDYAPGRNIYLTLDTELDSTPSEAELGRSTSRAASGAVRKQGRVLLG